MVVDIGISNLASVLRALDHVGAPVTKGADAAGVSAASAIILPGVGAFGEGMAGLRRHGLDRAIVRAAGQGVPVLGICLGMQLLAQSSEEHGSHDGLGLIAGHVRRLPETPAARVPNIGWCDVAPTRRSVLFPDVTSACYYHVHSFHFVPGDPDDVAATTRFGDVDVVVGIERDNVFGVQFHPEKSQDDGLALLASFLAHLRTIGRIS